MAKAMKISPDTKVIITDGNTNKSLPTDVASSNGDTSSVLQPAVPVGTKKSKTTKHKTDELPTVSSDLDDDSPKPDNVELPGDDSITSWSGDWFDGQRV
jgi:hypothetical protein